MKNDILAFPNACPKETLGTIRENSYPLHCSKQIPGIQMIRNIFFPLLLSLVFSISFLYTENLSMQDILNHAIQSGKNTLVIPKGVYHLMPPASNMAHLVISNARNLNIEAVGVKWICGVRGRALEILDCENLRVSGLTIDYDPLPFTQVKILTVSEGELNIEVLSGYDLLEVTTPKAFVFAVDPKILDYKSSYNLVFQSLIKTGNRSYTVKVAPLFTHYLAVGDILTVPQDCRSTHGILMWRSKKVTLSGLTLHAAPAMGIMDQFGSGNRYLECNLIPGPMPKGAEVSRLRVAERDSFHSYFAEAGPVYHRCQVEYGGDDFIAIHGFYEKVMEQIDGKTLKLAMRVDRPRGVQSSTLSVSNSLGFYRKNVDGIQVSKVISLAVEKPEKQTFAKIIDVDRLNPYLYFCGVARVSLDAPVEVSAGDNFVNLSKIGSGFEIISCRFKNGAARGLCLKAGDGLILSNFFDHLLAGAIQFGIENEEAEYAKNILIARNTINSVGMSPPLYKRMDTAAIVFNVIFSHQKYESHHFLPAGWHSNIRIEYNLLEDASDHYLLLDRVQDVRFIGNHLVRPGKIVKGHGKDSGLTVGAIAEILKARNVFFSNNQVFMDGMDKKGIPLVPTLSSDVEGFSEQE